MSVRASFASIVLCRRFNRVFADVKATPLRQTTPKLESAVRIAGARSADIIELEWLTLDAEGRSVRIVWGFEKPTWNELVQARADMLLEHPVPAAS